MKSLPRWAATAGLVFLVGCTRAPAPPPSFLILVIDALRADHVSAMGYARDTTPTLDRLASQGVLFTRNTSPSSYTLASVPSIFTALYPSAHGVLRHGRKRTDVLSDAFTTLAEALKQRGYSTAAFMPNPSLNRKFNFIQGFDVYRDDALLWRTGRSPQEYFETARKINHAALEWLGGLAGKPFLLYLHYRDTHGPYVPPDPYDDLYWKAPADGARDGMRKLTAAEYRVLPEYLRLDGDHGVLDYYLAQYDGEIRYTDDQIGDFLAVLEKRGLLANTVIFVTADHGESFLEHGTWNHGTGLYEEELHTPLVLVDPAARHGGLRIDAPVQTLDIYPTILERLGEPVPGELQGRSLLGVAEGRIPAREAVFSEGKGRNGADLAAIRAGRWKLIRERKSGTLELYDLDGDPREQRNLAAVETSQVEELHTKLKAFLEGNTRIRDAAKVRRRSLDPKTVEELKALGYIQ